MECQLFTGLIKDGEESGDEGIWIVFEIGDEMWWDQWKWTIWHTNRPHSIGIIVSIGVLVKGVGMGEGGGVGGVFGWCGHLMNKVVNITWALWDRWICNPVQDLGEVGWDGGMGRRGWGWGLIHHCGLVMFLTIPLIVQWFHSIIILTTGTELLMIGDADGMEVIGDL